MNMMKSGGPSDKGPDNDQPLIKIITASEKSLNEVYSLFLRVRAQLVAKGQGQFLLPRPIEAFEKSLQDDQSFLVGAYSPTGGELVGFCVVKKHESLSAAYIAGSLTLPDSSGLAHKLSKDGPIAVIQSLCVDVDQARQKGVAQKLLQCAKNMTDGHAQMAQTGVANLCGIKTFSKAGYVAVGAGTELSNQWPTAKLLLLRLPRKLQDKLPKHGMTLAPYHPQDLYGVQTALYRFIAHQGGAVKVQIDPAQQIFKVKLMPALTL